MYGIFTYIWLIFMGNVGKYSIHGSSGGGFFSPSNLSNLDSQLLLNRKEKDRAGVCRIKASSKAVELFSRACD